MQTWKNHSRFHLPAKLSQESLPRGQGIRNHPNPTSVDAGELVVARTLDEIHAFDQTQAKFAGDSQMSSPG